MIRQRDLEGYFLMDNSNSPGISDKMVHDAGLPPGVGRGKHELPSYRCNHCHTIVIMDARRTRERGFCRKCNRHVCDTCEAHRVASGGVCMPLDALIEEIKEREEKKLIVVV